MGGVMQLAPHQQLPPGTHDAIGRVLLGQEMEAPGAAAPGAAALPPVEADVLKILISSDTHLGYAERDPVRGNDSYDTFDEVFRLANEHSVDMVLLAGDLFHDNKPSRRALQRCMEIMRDHCLGNRPVNLEVVSDQRTNFHSKYHSVNFEARAPRVRPRTCARARRRLWVGGYWRGWTEAHGSWCAPNPTEAHQPRAPDATPGTRSCLWRAQDPNYNIQLPVFSIHGNHDDPAGDGGLAALDLMSTANLINYFGRADNFERISLTPVLIQKVRAAHHAVRTRRAPPSTCGRIHCRARRRRARRCRVPLPRSASPPSALGRPPRILG